MFIHRYRYNRMSCNFQKLLRIPPGTASCSVIQLAKHKGCSAGSYITSMSHLRNTICNISIVWNYKLHLWGFLILVGPRMHKLVHVQVLFFNQACFLHYPPCSATILWEFGMAEETVMCKIRVLEGQISVAHLSLSLWVSQQTNSWSLVMFIVLTIWLAQPVLPQPASVTLK